MSRPLYEINQEIVRDWTNMSPYAKPYSQAMGTMNSIHAPYFEDSGKSIVMYFLANAGSWRGETAKRIKKELNAMVKGA